jgi:hypothetical protein
MNYEKLVSEGRLYNLAGDFISFYGHEVFIREVIISRRVKRPYSEVDRSLPCNLLVSHARNFRHLSRS